MNDVLDEGPNLKIESLHITDITYQILKLDIF